MYNVEQKCENSTRGNKKCENERSAQARIIQITRTGKGVRKDGKKLGSEESNSRWDVSSENYNLNFGCLIALRSMFCIPRSLIYF